MCRARIELTVSGVLDLRVYKLRQRMLWKICPRVKWREYHFVQLFTRRFAWGGKQMSCLFSFFLFLRYALCKYIQSERLFPIWIGSSNISLGFLKESKPFL